MSRAAAAQATQVRSNLYVVTMPDGRVIISSKPLLHNDNGAVVNALTTKSIKQYDGSAILFLAYLELLNVIPDRCVTKTKLPAFPVWNNICAFLFGKPFYLAGASEFPSRQLARFSIAISCPHLLLATDEVVHAALCGDEDLAKSMIEANPRYLLSRASATDFSGRTFKNITPFQAALITGDVEMAEMMKPYFDRLQDGQVFMQKQVTEIFPSGIEAHEAAQKRKSETEFVPMLDELIAAIKNASNEDLQAALNNECNNSSLYLVLNKFRAAFTDLSHSEKIFNPHHLLGAFEAYATKFDWNNPDCNKLDLFWRQVIGFVQRFLPASYAQVVAYSVYDVVENKHTCPRTFNFRHDFGFSFYPLAVSFAGLGFIYAGGGCTATLAVLCGGWASAAVVSSCFQNLCRAKTASFSELITQRAQSTHSCLIHVKPK